MVEVTRDSVFKQLKKQNGEKAAQAICNAGLWTVPNILHIMEYAGKNESEITSIIPVLLEIYQPQEKVEHHSDLDPITLLEMAGYRAWYVNNEQEQNSIAGYFRSKMAVDYGMTGGAPRTNIGDSKHGELICTIYTNWEQGAKRFDDYYIINAVKKEAWGDDKLPEDKWHIKPSNNPKREDPYGTSVISIQILKTGGFISIKNRYNHTLKTEHPDSTFNSNPDNIIVGLSDSLRKHFGVDFTTTHAELPKNFRMVLDQVIRFNCEVNNVYFGSDYYFSGSNITKLKPNGSQILFSNGLMLDMAKDNSHIKSIAGADREMCNALDDFIQGKKITVTVAKDKTKTILLDGKHFMDIKDGMITFINAPKAPVLNLANTTLHGDLDFSNVEKLDLNGADLSACSSVKYNPNAKHVDARCKTFGGDVDFSNVKDLLLNYNVGGDFSNVTSFKLPKRRFGFDGIFEILNANKLTDVLDLEGFSSVTICASNLSNVDLIFGSIHRIVTLSEVTGMHGILNMSGVENIYLLNSDLSSLSELKLNSSANTISIREISGLSGVLDFSNVKYLELDKLDLSNVTDMKFGSNTSIQIIGCKNLHGKLDFSNVTYNVALYGTDFSHVTSLKLPSNLNTSLDDIIAPSGLFDVSHLTNSNLSFKNADLSRISDLRVRDNLTTLQFSSAKMPISGISLPGNITWLQCIGADFSNARKFEISGHVHNCMLGMAIGLHGDLDFSNVDKLDLTNADLSNVRSIKFNHNGVVSGLKPKDKLRFAFVNGVQKIEQRLLKKINTNWKTINHHGT